MEKKEDKRIGFLLERTTRIAKLSFNKAFAKLDVDITPEQWIVLDTLYTNGEMSQKDIGSSSFKNAPTISRIIDILHRKGLVDRTTDPEDRRVTTISLTDNGTYIVEKCSEEVAHLRALSWHNLSEKDYQDFLRIIDQVFNNFEIYSAKHL